MLCGNLCVKYVLKHYNQKYTTQKKLIWISQLALELNKYGLDVRLCCYNSNLYEAYISKYNVDYNLPCFKYLKNIEQNNINIEEKKLTKTRIKEELQKNDYLIICVKSDIFNDDKNMTGGHYIIATDIIGNNIKILNPIKSKCESTTMSLDTIIKACSSYGSWRILIRRTHD